MSISLSSRPIVAILCVSSAPRVSRAHMMHGRRTRSHAGSDSGILRSFLPCLTLAAHCFFKFKNVYLVEFASDRHDSMSIFHVNSGVDPESKVLVPLPNVFLNTQYQQNVFRIAFDPASQGRN